MSDLWMAISPAEIECANKIADRINKECHTREELIAAIQNVELYSTDFDVDWSAPFAADSESISGNVLAQIAYNISDVELLNEGNGVVLTPNILAEDMVKVSIIEWLTSNVPCSEKDLYDFIFDNKENEISSLVKSKCQEIHWYDPCVGGGAFPLAIAKVYLELGIDTPPNIQGYDIDPYYVEATVTRLSFVYGKSKRNQFEKHFLCEDALDTHLSQIGLFDGDLSKTKYDVAIGNPPYIRGTAIDPTAKKKYSENYPELQGKSTDLYTYFICNGINALKETGVLTFVTPAQFQISNYGKPIRRVMHESTEVRVVADFNELPVFKNVGVHTTVYCISKKRNHNDFRRYEYTELPQEQPLSLLYTDGFMLPQENIGEDGWVFSSTKAHLVLSFLESSGLPLYKYSPGVFSGIKSSCKKAFFLKPTHTEGFTEYDWNHCKKMILPKDIKKWKSDWQEDYFAIIKKDELLKEDSLIYKHMLGHRKELESRTDIVGHSTWYGLRQCGYYDRFEGAKIIYPDISTECRFSMDTESTYIPDGAFFIPGEDYYLLGLLNSCIGQYYFRQKCARIGNPKMGGRIRFKKVYVENFPVVDRSKDDYIAGQIERVVKTICEGICVDENTEILDELVLSLYDIPDEMRGIIKGE